MSKWNQAICDTDWEKLNPGRTAYRLVAEFRKDEICAWCGETTRSGIYVRVDPTTVPYPQEHDDD